MYRSQLGVYVCRHTAEGAGKGGRGGRCAAEGQSRALLLLRRLHVLSHLRVRAEEKGCGIVSSLVGLLFDTSRHLVMLESQARKEGGRQHAH